MSTEALAVQREYFHFLVILRPWVVGSPGGGGALPYKRLMGMCRWMGSHFHDWTDYNGVAFSKELLEWGRTFSDFWGREMFIFTVSKRSRIFVQ